VNLYPFKQTIAKSGVTPEQARGNIDIGGPCMIRASAKNFIRVASVVDPDDYGQIADEMDAGAGSTTLARRYRLARKAFAHTADYDTAIAGYLADTAFETVEKAYERN
jgi:phosphoribosylaminoimidazolecarboxamide formyltransferase/IMP cyclohydrolase